MNSSTNLAVALPEPLSFGAVEPTLQRLYAGESLDQASSETVFTALVEGLLPEPAIAAMLMALRFKGETAGAMIGAARRARAAAARALSAARPRAWPTAGARGLRWPPG